MTILLSGFPPVIDHQTHTLILGSFPGAKSLEIQQYYGYKHNQFWRLISSVLHENLSVLHYEDRLPRLLAHGFGLWDVIDACDRVGSLDSNIRHARSNDFSFLRDRYPALKLIGFNGKTSAKFESQFLAAGFNTIVLPSSSPAYAIRTFEQKLVDWKQLSRSSE
ncbi:DNA-deoxyinosine glycosylase [Undibacterium sp. RTI2.1]|uniref:DNA-deoxyinosine glycosylase n=1 Tax=unclassified Undibacterium TaxID=2630295 RepID=UPI002AB4763F|nr:MULTISPECIES: DNA-deoxyinosine glycosylase [unclassified Undibacterium]MDY7536898.1 DNA-deoxyinosine glycosylase [Undibacterium sp. 5I1]MEB0031672.1 DNA-deoxyinosine glycosylase [Undibacterium sp. RTI2.1]MEB0117943.1 DNA-deoxyinosine glycosylase [Undibacterium sp. RTI2.2]MEB0230403.1 DNA-deoxyinosine glycosylase [Undibacterium sp. 10I3]MEB0258821.1 DNA-deoxyinosine glycosylase [Undibacterium sp. 5I1]